MMFVRVKSSSTTVMHTLLMPSTVMVSLRCRSVGDTPIYDQLWGERINADVPPSIPDAHRLGHSGKHRRSEDVVGPGTHHGTGQGRPQRVPAYPAAGVTGGQRGAVSSDNSSVADAVGAGVPPASRHTDGGGRDAEQLGGAVPVNRPRTRYRPRHLLGPA